MTDESTVGKGKKIVVTVCVELHANWSQWILENLLLFVIWLIILFIFYLCNLQYKSILENPDQDVIEHFDILILPQALLLAYFVRVQNTVN